jgi:acetaldehyde dehydrogenase/alcohol dehydrogenase
VECPTKFTSFPKYESYIVSDKIYELMKKLGKNPKDKADAVEMLAQEVEALNRHLGIPETLQEYGIEEKDFLRKLPALADLAFGDQCTTANPRLPLVSELEQLYLLAYYGKGNVPKK